MIGSATKEMLLKEVIKKSLTYFESVSEKHSKSLLALTPARRGVLKNVF